jgi:hypothetical protein
MTATFHGHAMDKDASKEDMLRFFGAVDSGVGAIIGDHRAPLVLAGVGYLLPLYRQASSHRGIVERGIEGNPEHLTRKELHTVAWPLVEPLFIQDRLKAEEVFLAGAARTVNTIEEAVVAAYQGQIESIFVPVRTHTWGLFEPVTMTVSKHEKRRPGDRDLLDVAAAFTLIHGGNVFAVEPSAMPSSDPIAATLRF